MIAKRLFDTTMSSYPYHGELSTLPKVGLLTKVAVEPIFPAQQLGLSRRAFLRLEYVDCSEDPQNVVE